MLSVFTNSVFLHRSIEYHCDADFSIGKGDRVRRGLQHRLPQWHYTNQE
ncbi:hypothetical protein HW132_10675 [Brasilonema sp. CT11]|nr:hypothetical protein [Brasilonema sp. CT11]